MSLLSLVTARAFRFAKQVSGAYKIAPIFLIRMAGVVFEPLERLATPKLAVLARTLIGRKRERSQAKDAAEKFFHSRERLLSPEAYNALRTAVRLERAPAKISGELPPIFTDYALSSHAVADLEKELDAALAHEVTASRAALIDSAALLQRYLVFGSESVRGLLAKQLQDYPADRSQIGPRNNPARKVEQTLLLYLQRVAAKNDTFSEFGPAGWGKIAQEGPPFSVIPEPGVGRREAFLERWTAHAMVAAINADDEVFPELVPRLNPNGALKGAAFIAADSGETLPLAPDELEVARACDGRTPVHALGADEQIVRSLVSRGVLRCAVEVPALTPNAFATLRDDVTNWRSGRAREKWLPLTDAIADLPSRFAGTADIDSRQRLLSEAHTALTGAGAAAKAAQRFLYAAANPIGEECFRECHFTISEALINQVAAEAETWVDFWRDTYAFVASRVAEGLRHVLLQAAPGAKALPLPAFLRACETARLPLSGPGLIGLAVIAFQEVKAAFREQLRPHLGLAEYVLTAADCHIIRNKFEYPKFDEYTYPSADLQISAKSPEAIARGEYQWIIGELHPPAALLHHGFYWSCPDRAALNHAFAATTFGVPTAHFGFFAADFASHTTIRIFDALPQLAHFVAPQRGCPNWRTTRPADAEVFIDETNGDVAIRNASSREFLGSFARAWLIPLGFHPFQFGVAPHTPRLRCGNVIVQRRAWTIRQEELAPGDFTGLSRHLVLAIEQLRADRGLPRYVYIRPTEQALRRSGAEGRDKDTKPIFIDLESYLFLEIFHRWLVKAGELEVTEMLPDPEHLAWQESDGRRTFELRTLLVPRA